MKGAEEDRSLPVAVTHREETMVHHVDKLKTMRSCTTRKGPPNPQGESPQPGKHVIGVEVNMIQPNVVYEHHFCFKRGHLASMCRKKKQEYPLRR